MIKIHTEVAENFYKKLRIEQDKYEDVAAQKSKLIADMQGLIQIVEDDRKRQIEDFAKAYLKEHIILYH